MDKLQLLSKEDMILINGGDSNYDFGHEVGHDLSRVGHKIIKHLANARVGATSGYGVNAPRGYGLNQ